MEREVKNCIGGIYTYFLWPRVLEYFSKPQLEQAVFKRQSEARIQNCKRKNSRSILRHREADHIQKLQREAREHYLGYINPEPFLQQSYDEIMAATGGKYGLCSRRELVKVFLNGTFYDFSSCYSIKTAAKLVELASKDAENWKEREEFAQQLIIEVFGNFKSKLLYDDCFLFPQGAWKGDIESQQ